MIPGALVCVLFFAAHAYTLAAVSEADIKNYLSRLEKNYKINWSSPPYHDSDKYWEDTCPQAACRRVGKYTREELVQRGEGPKVKIRYEAKTREGGAGINRMSIPQKYSVKEAKWTINTRTQGWTVGGKMSGEIGKDGEGKAGVEISASYSDTSTSGTTEISEVTQDFECPARHECIAQTWTFYADITGTCKKKAMLDCNRQLDMCGLDGKIHNNCDQFTDVTKNGCSYGDNHCELNTLLYEDGGKPFTRLIWIATPISSGTKRSELDLPQPVYYIVD